MIPGRQFRLNVSGKEQIGIGKASLSQQFFLTSGEHFKGSGDDRELMFGVHIMKIQWS